MHNGGARPAKPAVHDEAGEEQRAASPQASRQHTRENAACWRTSSRGLKINTASVIRKTRPTFDKKKTDKSSSYIHGSYMALARHQAAYSARFALTAGAGDSATARSKCVAASLSSAAERAPP